MGTLSRNRFHGGFGCIALFAATCATACNCHGTTGSPLAQSLGVPSVAPSLNFGNVQVGQTVSLPLPMFNTGAGVLEVQNQFIDGGEFAEPTAFPASFGIGGTATARVSFAPTQTGKAVGTLTVIDDGKPTSVAVALLGNGLDLQLTVQPTSLAFGQVAVGITAPAQSVTFEDTGTTPLYLALSTAMTAPEYQLTVAGGAGGAPLPTAPIQLSPNTPYTVDVTFAPDQVSIFNSAFTYTACEDAAAQMCLGIQSVSLSGQGVSGALTFSPDPIVFSGVPPGTNATQQVTVTNTGAVSADVSCLYLQSLGSTHCGTSSSLFSLGTPSTPLPTTLLPSQSFSLSVGYMATGDAGTDVLEATFTSQGTTMPQTAQDPINGSTYPAPCSIAVSPASLTYSPVSVGNPLTESVTVSNSGNLDCHVSMIALSPSSDPSYALATGQATTFTLPGITVGGMASTATIGVTFDLNNNKPPSSRRGQLLFQTDDPTQLSVTVPLLASLASPYAGGGAWPRWHYDNLQSGLSPNDTSALTGTVAWSKPIAPPPAPPLAGVPVDYMSSPVVGSNGIVYQLGFDGKVHAVIPDGGTLWVVDLDAGYLGIDPHPGTPIIASDGTIYVGLGESGLGLFTISPTGQLVNSLPTSGDGLDLPPILTNSGFILAADDDDAAWAYSVANPSAPLLVATWTPQMMDFPFQRLTSDDQINAVVGPDDTTYFLGGQNLNAISSVDAGFVPLAAWPYQGGGIRSAACSNDPTDTCGCSTSDLAFDAANTGNLMVLYGGWNLRPLGDAGFGNGGNVYQTLASVNPATGAVIWTDNLPPPPAGTPNYPFQGWADATVGNSCPALWTDGTVYVGNFDGLHAVDGATGLEKPGFPFLTHSDVLTAPAIGADGTVFFGTADATFYAIHPDGSLRFSLKAGGRIAGSPAIGPGGYVYFIADDGNLYAVH